MKMIDANTEQNSAREIDVALRRFELLNGGGV